MSAEKRQEHILRILKGAPSVSTNYLSETLDVSRETVRSDLVRLEQMGVIERSHGSVRLADSPEAYESLVRSGALTRDERRDAILEALRPATYLRNVDLARQFNVTEATIRSDLDYLERRGRISRRHGGAVATEDAVGSVHPAQWEPAPTPIRQITDRALGLIERGDLIFLDDSVFSQHIARRLPEDLGADVVTNSLPVAMALTTRRYRSEVFILPGRVSGETASTDFQMREAVAARLNPTRSFLGFRGYTPERGFATDTRAQADLADYVISHSREVYLMLDSESVERSGNYSVPIRTPTGRMVEIMVDELVTEERAARLFPREYHVAICGDSYVLKSPFDRQYVIGFATLNLQHEFSRSVTRGIEHAADSYPNIELIVADNRMSPETTMANVDTFIGKGVDLVIEYQNEFRLSALIGEKLSHAGIPVVAVDIPIPGAVYFGANNYRAGRIAGAAAAAEVHGRWDGAVDALFVLSEEIAGPTPASRITGMLEAFREAVPIPDQQVMRIETENDRSAAAHRLRGPIEALPREARVVIFGFNDEVTLGALDALDALDGRTAAETAVVVGHNVTPAIRRELARIGTPLLGCVAFHPDRYGSRILDIALGILDGTPGNPDNYTDHEWVGRATPAGADIPLRR